MPSESARQGLQYLTFRLDRELFAVDIGRVREVLEFKAVTKVPRTPAFVRGVINLRGNVVAVVDMRLKLGFPSMAATVDTCVVIAEVVIDRDRTILGALVDSVQEVVEIDAAQIVPAPHVGARIDPSVIQGVGKRSDELVMILDMDRVFSAGELRGMPGS